MANRMGRGTSIVVCFVVLFAASAVIGSGQNGSARASSIADFEEGTFGGWQWEGTCAGRGPETRTFAGNALTGWEGRYFLSTAHPRASGWDIHSGTGRGVSPSFVVTGDTIQFLIAGGRHEGRCCLNLVVDGTVVRSATGQDPYQFRPVSWDVREWQGKTAHLEILDQRATAPHGYIHIDNIVMTGLPEPAPAMPANAPPPMTEPVAMDVEPVAESVLPSIRPPVRPPPVPVLRPPIAPYTHDPLPTDKVIVPMIFPLLGKVAWHDNYNDDRGTHRHTAIDISARKMHPILAPFAGRIGFKTQTFWIYGDNGYRCLGTHLNDDTPGTEDNSARWDYMFAPNLRNGDRVIAGQLIGYVGNSGNATGPHLHFELFSPDGLRNPAPSLRRARYLTAPRLSLGPATDWPAPGQVRIVGCPRGWDAGRRVLTVLQVARQEPGGKTTIMTSPWYYYANLPLSVTTALTPGTLAELPGDRVLSLYLPSKAVNNRGVALRVAFPAPKPEGT